MELHDAEDLLAGAVPKAPGTWADLGAGAGTFTRALAQLLGPGGRIYAVDRDARALANLVRQTPAGEGRVIPVTADFAGPFDLPGVEGPELDGVLLANALHFLPDPGAVLARLVHRLRPGGRVVVVEYDGRPANRWVPYPIPRTAIPGVMAQAGLTAPTITATRPSAFGGALYVAWSRLRPSPEGTASPRAPSPGTLGTRRRSDR